MKIGYFGDGPWAHKAFERLNQDSRFSIEFICVRYDHQDPILKNLGEINKIPVFFERSINDPTFIQKIKSFGCDILVSMSFNQIFKTEIINCCPLKTINCHAGKLPFYRGRNILNWALINDEKEFGITVHYVDEGIDTGDVILQKCYPISDNDNYKTLLERAYEGCADTLFTALEQLEQGKAERIPQTKLAPVGFYCGRRIPGDEIIQWNQTSRELFNFIRAICSPGPKATTYLGNKTVTIDQAHFIPHIPSYKGVPGQVLGKTKDGFLVKSQDGYIEITNIEIEGEGKILVGDRFSSIKA